QGAEPGPSEEPGEESEELESQDDAQAHGRSDEQRDQAPGRDVHGSEPRPEPDPDRSNGESGRTGDAPGGPPACLRSRLDRLPEAGEAAADPAPASHRLLWSLRIDVDLQ